PNFGSGRISRLGTSRRRGISIPFSLQLSALCALAVAIMTIHLLDRFWSVQLLMSKEQSWVS
ncbi:MAG: hypothetical protein V4631_23260, partial [Pseudomonadota bacterium]